MADIHKEKRRSRATRKTRSRSKLFGTAERPRLVIYKSLSQIYTQLMNDQLSVCITGASSRAKELAGKKMPKKEMSSKVGELIAVRAKEKGIEKIIFDRSGYPYHGRIKALAEGARKGGLKF
jgi:large subunit ribosomal protein L18